MKFFLNTFLCGLAAFVFIGCATKSDDPQPEGEKLSSLPHNLPASWEGQAGMGAAFNQQ